MDGLGRSTQNMLDLASELRTRDGLRVLNLGGDDVDTATPTGSTLFTIMAELTQMDHEVKRESVTDSIDYRRGARPKLGGRTTKDHRQPNLQRAAWLKSAISDPSMKHSGTRLKAHLLHRIISQIPPMRCEHDGSQPQAVHLGYTPDAPLHTPTSYL